MPLQDEALARRAAAGDSDAFAELYDRYERATYNLCYRITASREDAADATQETFLKVLERLPRLEGRELNVGAYVMTAARNASYDALERRKRATPTDDIPDAVDHEVPERTALREAHQEQIRAANEGLPPRQREVLALRELQDLSYGEVAQIMGMNQNSVAQLISRARINLRDGLRQTALSSVASASPQCDRALPLLASHQDGVLEDPWLAEHLMECGPCRVRLEAMEEAAVAYRQWLLLVPALWLRDEVAHAAERARSRAPRARKVLAAAGATFALALSIVASAESPTRMYAPATPETVAVVHAAPAPKPVAQRRAPKPRRRAKTVVAKKRHVAAPPPRPVAMPDEPTRLAVARAEPTQPAKADDVAPRARPRRQVQPTPEPVVLADPPPVEPPAPTTDEPPPADDTRPTPPCQSTSAAGCPPPPRPPVVTCTSCPLVAQPPNPPTRVPLLVVAPTRR